MPRSSKPRKSRAVTRTPDTARRQPRPTRAAQQPMASRARLRLDKRPPQFPGRQGGR